MTLEESLLPVVRKAVRLELDEREAHGQESQGYIRCGSVLENLLDGMSYEQFRKLVGAKGHWRGLFPAPVLFKGQKALYRKAEVEQFLASRRAEVKR